MRPTRRPSSLRRSRLLLIAGAFVLAVAATAQARSHGEAHHRRRSHPVTARTFQRERVRVDRAPAGSDRLVLAPRRVLAVKAHAASDASVTVADFQFTPATITIHVGDTVTWTNHGPSAHTATANNGSFNTGILQKGQSGSHTFPTAGTFAYHCAIHTFMHGTVVVLASSGGSTTPPATGSGSSGKSANGSNSPSSGSSQGTGSSGASTSGGSSSGGPTSGGSDSSDSSTPASSRQATLPVTGLTVTALVAVGLLLLLAGLALRRKDLR